MQHDALSDHESADPHKQDESAARNPESIAIDHVDALYRISLRIARSSDLETDLQEIVDTIRVLLDLDTVSLFLQNFGIVVHSDRSDESSAGSSATESTSFRPRILVDLNAEKPTGSSVRIPVHHGDQPVGFMLVRIRVNEDLDPELSELLAKIGSVLAESVERERSLAGLRADRSGYVDVKQLLDILSRIATLPRFDENVQPLLFDIAELLDAVRVSIIAPDPLKPRLFASGTSPMADVDDELLRLVAAPAVRQALNSGQMQVIEPEHRPEAPSTPMVLMAVPITAQNEITAVLVVESDRERKFSFGERETVAVIGHHLSVCLERESSVHAYVRQNLLLALVERVTVFIAQSMNADDFLALMTREIRRTFGYDCSIAMIAGNRLVFHGIELGEDEPIPEWLEDGIPLESGIMGRVARTGEPAFVRNVRSDPAFIDTGRNTVSEIAVPIRMSGDVVGVLNVESSPENPLRGIDYEILLVLANHIGIALRNRSLIASERETRMAMEAIQRVSTIVAETLDPDESLWRIARTLGESLGYPLVSLALLEGRELVLKANYGYASNSNPRALSVDEGISGRVVSSGHPVFLEDVNSDPDYVRDRPDLTSEVCVPIRCNGEIVGILNVEGTRARPVTERDLHLLTTFAEHAGVLLNNARAYAALSQEATLDPMTGVPNLRFFQQELHNQIQHMQRTNKPLSLAVIDLDNLKEINDRHGHLIGDQVLRALARHLSMQLRSGDVLARYAGDEFVAIFPGVDEKTAMDVARRLLDTTRQNPFMGEGGIEIGLSVSIGVATYPQDAPTSSDLVHAADMAMYAAKESGKSRVSSARQAEQIRQQPRG